MALELNSQAEGQGSPSRPLKCDSNQKSYQRNRPARRLVPDTAPCPDTFPGKRKGLSEQAGGESKWLS